MDLVVIYREGKLFATEFRHKKKGDLVCVGQTEEGQEGVFVYIDGFVEEKDIEQAFAFLQNRSRETSMSRENDELYDLFQYEKRARDYLLGSRACLRLRLRRAQNLFLTGGRRVCFFATCRQRMIWKTPIFKQSR